MTLSRALSLLSLAPAVVAAAAAGAVAARAARGAGPRDEARALDATLGSAAARARASVVRIRPVASEGTDVATLARRTRTGVALEADLVVTDATAITSFGLDELVVEAFDGVERKARLRGRDQRLRLVALEVEGGGLTPVERSPAAPDAGMLVLALGAVLSRAAPSATFGIVSAGARFDGRVFQTDATVDPSNAGGPVVDLEGRALGVSVIVDRRIGDGSGIGFAVPIARIEPVLGRLRKGDDLAPGMLGIVLAPTGEGEGGAPGALATGVRVDAVRTGGPAAAAGLRAGDVIVAIDTSPGPAGAPPGPRSRVLGSRGFLSRLSLACAGDKVRLAARRGVDEVVVDVTLAPRR